MFTIFAHRLWFALRPVVCIGRLVSLFSASASYLERCFSFHRGVLLRVLFCFAFFPRSKPHFNDFPTERSE